MHGLRHGEKADFSIAGYIFSPSVQLLIQHIAIHSLLAGIHVLLRPADCRAYAAAEAAVAAYNNTEFRGVIIRVQMQQRDPNARRKMQSAGNLVITGLPRSKAIDNASLADSFEAWGKIVSSRVKYDPAGWPLFGYIQFENPACAQQAMRQVSFDCS